MNDFLNTRFRNVAWSARFIKIQLGESVEITGQAPNDKVFGLHLHYTSPPTINNHLHNHPYLFESQLNRFRPSNYELDESDRLSVVADTKIGLRFIQSQVPLLNAKGVLHSALSFWSMEVESRHSIYCASWSVGDNHIIENTEKNDGLLDIYDGTRVHRL